MTVRHMPARFRTSDHGPLINLDPVITEIKALEFSGIQIQDLGHLRATRFKGVGLIADEDFGINLKTDTDIIRLNPKPEKAFKIT